MSKDDVSQLRLAWRHDKTTTDQFLLVETGKKMLTHFNMKDHPIDALWFFQGFLPL